MTRPHCPFDGAELNQGVCPICDRVFIAAERDTAEEENQQLRDRDTNLEQAFANATKQIRALQECLDDDIREINDLKDEVERLREWRDNATTLAAHMALKYEQLATRQKTAQKALEAFCKFRNQEYGYDIWGTEAAAAWTEACDALHAALGQVDQP